MASGPNWGDPLAPNAQGLWNLNFKFNTDQNSFNMKFHLAEKTEAQARAIGIDLSARLKCVMPQDCDIFDAIMSKENTVKDGRYIPEAIGPGLFISLLVPPKSTYDFAKTALLVRFEHAGGSSVTTKFSMLPDEKVDEARLVLPITPTVGTPLALPAAPLAADPWELTFANLLAAITMQCQNVNANRVPAAPYTYFQYQNAYPIRIGAKKGGRVFSS